ncbi:MAG: hypothetical protein HYR58_03635 [Acidobacteria bacterium]|nr:hypothetical protein [Acidobacteriota bacterium]
MKKVLVIIGACIIAALLLFLGSAFFLAQRADYGWDPAIATPGFIDLHPRVLIDEGHHNSSTAGITGRYWPFARLLRADGYTVERGEEAFTPGYLDGVQVLVIALRDRGDPIVGRARRLPAPHSGSRAVWGGSGEFGVCARRHDAQGLRRGSG